MLESAATGFKLASRLRALTGDKQIEGDARVIEDNRRTWIATK